MAKVYFYPAKLDFAKLVALATQYPSTTDFAYLVFQTEIEDSAKKIDEYVLTAYRVGSDWSVKQKLDSTYLTTDYAARPYDHSGKLFFANYPLSRSKINAFVSLNPTPPHDLIDYIYFEPEEYPKQKKYVHFKVTAIFKDSPLLKTTNADTELNPSPPADPQV